MIDRFGARTEEINDEEIVRRKAFLQFEKEDIDNLTDVQDLAGQYATEVIEDFYRHIMSFPDTRVFFQDPLLLERVKERQKQYFMDLTRGSYGSEYIQGRLRIGQIHERIGLPIKTYLGMYRYYLAKVADKIFEAHKDHPIRALSITQSLLKLVFFDIGLAIDTYLQNREPGGRW